MNKQNDKSGYKQTFMDRLNRSYVTIMHSYFSLYLKVWN